MQSDSEYADEMSTIVTAIQTSSPNIESAYATVDLSGTVQRLVLIVQMTGTEVTDADARAVLVASSTVLPARVDSMDLSFSPPDSALPILITDVMVGLGLPPGKLMSEGRRALIDRSWLDPFAAAQ